MPRYEIMCVARARSPAAKVLSMLRAATHEVTGRGGVLRGVQNLGTRQLAYRIRAHQEWNYIGRYFFLQFEASPRAIREVNHVLKTNVHVVRWLTHRRKTASRKPLIIRGTVDESLGVDPGVYLFKHRQHLDWRSTRMMLQAGMIKADDLRERVRRIVPKGSRSAGLDSVELDLAADQAVTELLTGSTGDDAMPAEPEDGAKK